MNLNIDAWKPFITARLFPVLKPGKANQQLLDEGNDCFYVGAKKDDNGVMLHCAWDESLVQKGNCVIFICNGQGSVGYANYMDRNFIGTTDIVAGYNDNLNPLIGNFLATVYSLERPKYSFGRKWKTHLKTTEVKLPVLHNEDGSIFIDASHKYSDEGYVPDWSYMEECMKSLHHKPLTTRNKPDESDLGLEINLWKEFYVGNLFDKIYKSVSYDKDELTTSDSLSSDTLRYITRTDCNNGCEIICKSDDLTNIEEGNAISIGDTTASCYYQNERFVTGEHMVILRSSWLNVYTGLFVVSLLKMEKYRYSYGRAFLMSRICDTKLKLPVLHNDNGSIFIDSSHKYSDEGYVPDWDFMERYIMYLPYGDRI